MRIFQHVLWMAIAVSISGCATAPHFPRRVSVEEVMYNVRCELYRSVEENIEGYPWLERWAAAFDITFTVDRDVNASADTSYLVPVNLGTFTLGLKANLKQSAMATYNVKFEINKGLGKFRELDCSSARRRALTPRRLLNGEIGLYRWLNEIIPQVDGARITNPVAGEPNYVTAARAALGATTGLTYTINFGVTADGSLLPSWVLNYPSGRSFRPGINLTASNVTTHKLVVALTPIAPATPADATAVYGIVDGKRAIIARRVCVMSRQDGTCFDEATSNTKTFIDQARKDERDLKNQIKMARANLKEKKSKKLVFEAFDKQVIMGIKPTVEDFVKDLPVSEREAVKQSDQQSLADDTQRKTIVRSLDQEINDDQSRINRLENELNDVRRERRQAERVIRAQRSRRTLQTRQIEAGQIASSERETSRRLENLIQQQIIRDAFRQ